MKNYLKKWEKLLNSEILKANLVAASLFISTYEMCKAKIIGNLKHYYSHASDQNNIKQSSYENKVLIFGKDQLSASLNWFKSEGAINDNDITVMEELREYRNDLVHELPKFILENHEIMQSRFVEIKNIMNKIGKWWVINIEIPSDPEFSNNEVNIEDVNLGILLVIEKMECIALNINNSMNEYH